MLAFIYTVMFSRPPKSRLLPKVQNYDPKTKRVYCELASRRESGPPIRRLLTSTRGVTDIYRNGLIFRDLRGRPLAHTGQTLPQRLLPVLPVPPGTLEIVVNDELWPSDKFCYQVGQKGS